MVDYQSILQEIEVEINRVAPIGDVAQYIPELAKVNPKQFGIHLCSLGGGHYALGHSEQQFSIQSISKPFALALALSKVGSTLWDRVGMEPSGTSFNSLVQLEVERGIPRNPFINAGAIVVCDILLSVLDNPLDEYLAFMRTLSDSSNVEVNKAVFNSEKETGHRNYALAHFMKSFNNLNESVEDVLHLYFGMCSIEMSCRQLAQATLFLANDGADPYNNKIITPSQSKRINAIMQTCGFYDEAGEFSFRVGLPGKSGVGGGIMALHPHEYSVAVWSPKLNDHGNSYLGMKTLELLTEKTDSSIF